MTPIDYLFDGLAIALLIAVLLVGLVIVYYLLYSAFVYIGCKIPSIPIDQHGVDIIWKGELKHEGDDDMPDNGFYTIGLVITWIGIIMTVLMFIGYVANQLGVNP